MFLHAYYSQIFINAFIYYSQMEKENHSVYKFAKEDPNFRWR